MTSFCDSPFLKYEFQGNSTRIVRSQWSCFISYGGSYGTGFYAKVWLQHRAAALASIFTVVINWCFIFWEVTESIRFKKSKLLFLGTIVSCIWMGVRSKNRTNKKRWNSEAHYACHRFRMLLHSLQGTYAKCNYTTFSIFLNRDMSYQCVSFVEDHLL